MNGGWKLGLALAAAGALAAAPAVATAEEKQRLAFGGGPTGGTFQYFAKAIALMLSKQLPNVEVSSEGTRGSAENLKRLDSGEVDFGIVYSGDLWLGARGELPRDRNKYTKVRPIAYLYGAPAQLVARKDSGITDPMQLVGRKVAVGNAGSGAALSAQRYFEAIGIWDEIEPQFLGYSLAASALGDERVDAFWVLVGYPNASIIEASSTDDIVLLDLDAAAQQAGFYEKFPFYAATRIPAGTYEGQTREVKTFQDSTLWCASDAVDPKLVYSALKAVYSPEGLEQLVKAHKAATEMSVARGIEGVPLALHRGAERFWREQGKRIPPELRAR